jgi:DNA repair protein RecN (Recombination protein N)
VKSSGGDLSLRGAGRKSDVLTQLSARNFSLLKDTSFAFSRGLNVITGESGAGKSLIIDALQFALGKRPNQTFIGTESDECSVSASFELPKAVAKAHGLPSAIEIERTFSRNGRGCLTLNGEQVLVSYLKDLMSPLVDVSTQFAQQDLFRPSFHREILDAFGDASFQANLVAFRTGFSELQGVRQELASRRAAATKGIEERNYLEFLVGELGAANVSAGDRERISSELYMLEHAEDILRRASSASQMLYGEGDENPSAFDLIAKASEEMGSLQVEDLGESKLGKVIELLATALDAVSEAKEIISDLSDVPDYSAPEIERLRRRLDEINSLEHKYSISADEIPLLLERSLARLDALHTSPEALLELEAKVKQLEGELLTQALKLNEFRRNIGEGMAKTVGGYLSRLGFRQARCIAEVNEPEEMSPDGLREYGVGRSEFIVCLNPGEPARPLAEVASGGEASRLMLAVKAALQGKLSYATIVFDEIEAGVGGDAAFNVAHVLRDLSAGHQVIAVTHLAPVAAAGDHHLEAVKAVKSGATDIKVVILSGKERTRALARMLGDPERPESLALADSFLQRMATRN